MQENTTLEVIPVKLEISYSKVDPLQWTTGRQNLPHITEDNFWLPLPTAYLFVITSFHRPTDAGKHHFRGLSSKIKNFI